MITTMADQQRGNNHQQRRHSPMMTNKRQPTGRDPDSRRLTNSKSNQYPTKSNRYDALVDELVDDGSTFHQPGTSSLTKGSQSISGRQGLQSRRTRWGETSSVFIWKPVVVGITFVLQSKNEAKNRCWPQFKLLSRTLQLHKKHKMLYAPFVLTCTKLMHLWTPEQSKMQCRKLSFEK